MEWLNSIFMNPSGAAYMAIALAFVIWSGVKLGQVKIGGVALGVTFVLFMGIIVGDLYNRFIAGPNGLDLTEQNHVLHFVQELGLMLFVFCIGLQVGPSFFSTFKQGGVRMNLLSVGIILLNVLVMVGLFYLVYYQPGATAANKESLAMMTGVMYGAVTNTPGLGAAQSVLPSFFGDGAIPSIADGYACAYPLGVVGIIGATILIRYLTKVNLDKEREEIEKEQEADPSAMPHHFYLKVTNKGVFGRTLKELHEFVKRDFVCSRCKINGEMFIPNGDQKLEEGMELYMVCAWADMEAIETLIGERMDVSWRKEIEANTHYVSQRMTITNPAVDGKTLNDLHFSTLFNVNVTRVVRAGITLFASRSLRLQLGDRLLLVGSQENLNRVREVIGDAEKRLDHPNVAIIFLGILVGVLVGQIPIPLGLSVPVKLGLAGGPLIVAILIGAFGYKFNLTTYMRTSANMTLREVGLCLFLAGVGIKAGGSFVDTIVNKGGLNYIWIGFIITIVPIIIGGLIGRLKLKLNYLTLMGMIAGTYTDPPALAFANQTAGNNAPAIGYSTVYPLSMFLRILTAQLVLAILMPFM